MIVIKFNKYHGTLSQHRLQRMNTANVIANMHTKRTQPILIHTKNNVKQSNYKTRMAIYNFRASMVSPTWCATLMDLQLLAARFCL